MQDSDCVSGSYYYIFDPGIRLSNRVFNLLQISEGSVNVDRWSRMHIGHLNVSDQNVGLHLSLLLLNFKRSPGYDTTDINLLANNCFSIFGFILSMFSVVWSEILLWWIEGFV